MVERPCTALTTLANDIATRSICSDDRKSAFESKVVTKTEDEKIAWARETARLVAQSGHHFVVFPMETAQILLRRAQEVTMADGIVVGGVKHSLKHPVTGHPIPVFGPKDTGIEFKIGTGHNKRRTEPITGGVIHYTGSENAVETMFSVLNNRELGVEFAISALGSLFQFCDPLIVDTADAGAANKMTWGVEIVNQGIRKILDPRKWGVPRAQKKKGIDLGPRPMYETTIHGRRQKMWGFYPQQVATMCALNEVMVRALPKYGDGVCTEPNVIDFKNFHGAMGHYNITERKIDPGTLPMEQLAHFMKTGKIPFELERELMAVS